MTQSRPGDIFQPGDLLNNTYRIQALLGRGGTSEVYKARSEISGRLVALKALKSEYSTNEDYLVLMTREEDIRDVRHDAIVRYYDNQRMPDGVVYLVMDLIDGPGMDVRLKDGGMSADDLMVIAERVAEGLHAAHTRNIVHRDLSPDNIILRNGAPDEAVIIDFGIAKDTNPGAETIVGNEFAGKYAYAAPEQLSGQTDARSDIYALGALLLATYRGEKPDMGANPMEVVQRKAVAPNVDGVPDPLRSLIQLMCQPVPEARFQTASDLLEAIRGTPSAPSNVVLEDATVISAPPKPVPPQPAPGGTPTTPGPKRKSGALVSVVLASVLLIAGVGAYVSGALDGLLNGGYPVADPYQLVIEKADDTAPIATGHVPNPDTEAALIQAVQSAGGRADLTLASGQIAQSWGKDVLDLLDTISPLDEFRMDVNGNMVELSGLTENRVLFETMRETLEVAMPGSLDGTVDLTLGPRILPVGRVTPLIEEFADCGPLDLIAPPAAGYAMGQRLLVEGRLAQAGSRVGLYDALTAISGDRPVTIDTEILSPALCKIETALPTAPSGGVDILFGFGDRSDANPNGRYFVGENPVIDVVIPATVTDGFLWVSVLDVSGNVFHLLPNLNRPDNRVAALRAGQDGEVTLRVAYGVDEASDPSRLAFLVDATTLGKSKIIVLQSGDALFDGVRPTTESAESYADALRAARDTGSLGVTALDTALLVTEQP